jgi:hypothetical protein
MASIEASSEIARPLTMMSVGVEVRVVEPALCSLGHEPDLSFVGV